MDSNMTPENARLTVTVTVRREAKKPPVVRVTTDPASSQNTLSRTMEESVPDDLVRRLPAGQYRIARTMRSGSWMASSPPCLQELLERLIDCLLEPMDDAFRSLRQALSYVPDADGADWIAFELLETALQEMIENGTLSDIRPGRFRVIVCSYPSGLDNPESVADKKKGAVSSRGVLSKSEWPVLYVYEEGGIRAFLGVTEDDHPFRDLIEKRVRSQVDRVQAAAFDRAVREAYDAIARSADQYRSYAEHLGRAFKLDGPRSEGPEEIVVYQNGGDIGEA